MNHLNKTIGSNIKRIRQERGLSLEKLGELTGVSKTMLGQIERGESNPTVTTIWKIANGVHLSFSSLITEKESIVSIIHKGKIEPIVGDNGKYRVYPLVPFQPDRQFELFSIELDMGFTHYSEAHNTGVEEYVIINEGKLDLQLNNEIYSVGKDDSIRFKADQPHSYSNNGNSLLKYTVLIHYSR